MHDNQYLVQKALTQNTALCTSMDPSTNSITKLTEENNELITKLTEENNELQMRIQGLTNEIGTHKQRIQELNLLNQHAQDRILFQRQEIKNLQRQLTSLPAGTAPPK